MASISKQSKETQDRHRKLLVEMLKKPENAECMDCRARNPTWASINLGVFVCIRCSGLHRQVGVHISKVRSCTMDLWEPEQIAFMQSMGNARGKALYEALLPPDYGKPSENEDSQLVLQWIRTKYEKKRYFSPNPAAVMAANLSSSSPQSPNGSTHVNLESMKIRPAKAKKPRAEGTGAMEGGAAQSPCSPQPPSSPINEFSYEQFMSPAIQSPRQSDFESAPPGVGEGAPSAFSFLQTGPTTAATFTSASHATGFGLPSNAAAATAEGSAFSFVNAGRQQPDDSSPTRPSAASEAVGGSIGASAFSFLNELPVAATSAQLPLGGTSLTASAPELPPDSLLSFSNPGGVPLIPGHFATPNVPLPTGGILFDPFDEPAAPSPKQQTTVEQQSVTRPPTVPAEPTVAAPAAADDPQALLAAMQQQMILLQQLALATAQQQSA